MSRKTRKLIWSAPLVAVFAVVGALAIFMTAAPGDISAQTADVDYQAGSPLNLTVEPGPGAAKRTSLVITWTAPTAGSDMPITGYRIDQSTDNGQRWTHLTNVGAGVLTHTDSGLKPGTEKYYRVFAMNRAGTGRVSEAISEVTAMISEPGQVGNLRLTSTSDTVTLNWDAPTDNGGTRIIGYLIHFSADDANHIRGGADGIPARTADGTADAAGNSDGIIPVLASSGTTYVHKGLPANLDLSYKVYAVNWSDDEGVARTTKDPVEKRDITTMEASRPSAPTGLTAVPLVNRVASDQDEGAGDVVEDVAEAVDATPVNQSAGHINLYWYWPQTDGGDGITTFRVEVSKTGQWPSSSADPADDITAFNAALTGNPDTDTAAADFAAMNVTAEAAFPSTARPQPAPVPARQRSHELPDRLRQEFAVPGVRHQWSGPSQPAFQRIIPEYCDVRHDPGDETRA